MMREYSPDELAGQFVKLLVEKAVQEREKWAEHESAAAAKQKDDVFGGDRGDGGGVFAAAARFAAEVGRTGRSVAVETEEL